MDQSSKFYKVVRHHQQNVFEEMVSGLIEKGWRPVGGLEITKDNKHGFEYFHQSMVNIKDQTKKAPTCVPAVTTFTIVMKIVAYSFDELAFFFKHRHQTYL